MKRFNFLFSGNHLMVFIKWLILFSIVLVPTLLWMMLPIFDLYIIISIIVFIIVFGSATIAFNYTNPNYIPKRLKQHMKDMIELRDYCGNDNIYEYILAHYDLSKRSKPLSMVEVQVLIRHCKNI